MPVLVDTSVWRGFFSGRAPATVRRGLAALLDGEEVILVHPAVLGELVLGGLSPREEALLRRLPGVKPVPDDEVLAFVRHHRLTRKGIGWVDAHLLASARVAGAALWSADERLARVADALGVEFLTET